MNRWLLGFLLLICFYSHATEYVGTASTVTSKERTTPLLVAQLSDEAVRQAIKKANLRAAVGSVKLHEDDILMSTVYWPLMVDVVHKQVDSQPCKDDLVCSTVTVVITLDEETFTQQVQEIWMTNQIEVNVDRFHKYPSHVFVSQLEVLDKRIEQLEQRGGSGQALDALLKKKAYLTDLVTQSKQLRLAYEINKYYTNMGIFGEPTSMKRETPDTLSVSMDVRGYGDPRFASKFKSLLEDMGYNVTIFHRAIQQGTLKDGISVGLSFSDGAILKAGQLCAHFNDEFQLQSLQPILNGQSTLTIPLLGSLQYVRVGDIKVEVKRVWPKEPTESFCIWEKFEYMYDISVDESLLALYAQERMDDLPLTLTFDMSNEASLAKGNRQTLSHHQPVRDLGVGVNLPLLEVDNTKYQQYLIIGCDAVSHNCRSSNTWY